MYLSRALLISLEVSLNCVNATGPSVEIKSKWHWGVVEQKAIAKHFMRHIHRRNGARAIPVDSERTSEK